MKESIEQEIIHELCTYLSTCLVLNPLLTDKIKNILSVHSHLEIRMKDNIINIRLISSGVSIL